MYSKLGVRKAISCRGTYTDLGGSIVDPRVIDVMKEASRTHVLMEELHVKAGKYVAELLGVEAAFITTGAAGGLLLATAALIAGNDPARMSRLPCTAGMKNEVLICKCQRFAFDHPVRAAGGRFVEFGHGTDTAPWEMEAAINERTAYGLWLPAQNSYAALPFEVFRDIAKSRGVPVVVDCAGETPPVDNLTRYSKLGADLVVISGGKGIRGPQSTGLVVGKKELVNACRANSSPNLFIGRPLKVGKEEICGLVAALEIYLNETSITERDLWEKMVGHIVDRLRGIPGVEVRRHFPYQPTRHVPIIVIRLEEESGLSTAEVFRKLAEKDPPIYAYAPGGFGYQRGRGFILNPHTMLEGEEYVVAERLREVLTRAA